MSIVVTSGEVANILNDTRSIAENLQNGTASAGDLGCISTLRPKNMEKEMKMKSAAILINVSHALGIGMPLVLHFSSVLVTGDAFFLSATLCAAIAVGTSLIWSGLISGTKVLAADVPFEKHAGLSSAGLICFGPLWFIPTRFPLPVSDAIWSTSAREYGQTVRTALRISSDPLHYVVGALALGGLYVGISGDFGITLSRLAGVVGGRSSIQALLIGVAAWVSVLFLFNGFFRAFLRHTR